MEDKVTNYEQLSVMINQKLQVLSDTVSRAALASSMTSYDGKRNVTKALGYPVTIQFNQYWDRYKRQDMAKAIIDRPVTASWKGTLQVKDSTKGEKTPFEKAWNKFYQDFKLKNLFIRTDKLTGIGRYSVILFGMDDCKTIEDYTKPIKKGAKLLFLKPFSEASATIDKLDEDPKSRRFGLPLYYMLGGASGESEKNGKTMLPAAIKVHYTRILHVVENVLENEVYGTPRLEAVFNRLLDLEKVIGGDAEMFWRGARPGYVGKVDKEYSMTPKAKKDLINQIDEFENDLRRLLVNDGVTYEALEQQIADPLPHVDVIVQMVSAVTTIPKRILVGSERGELSSAQDKQEWISYVTTRREEQNEPMILRPFIDKCVEHNILPKPENDDYIVIWDKLFDLSDKEKVDVGKTRAEAIKEYTYNPVAVNFLPMTMFLEFILGMDPVQVERVIEAQKEGMASGDDEMMNKIAETLKKQQEAKLKTTKETTTEKVPRE